MVVLFDIEWRFICLALLAGHILRAHVIIIIVTFAIERLDATRCCGQDVLLEPVCYRAPYSRDQGTSFPVVTPHPHP